MNLEDKIITSLGEKGISEDFNLAALELESVENIVVGRFLVIPDIVDEDIESEAAD